MGGCCKDGGLAWKVLLRLGRGLQVAMLFLAAFLPGAWQLCDSGGCANSEMSDVRPRPAHGWLGVVGPAYGVGGLCAVSSPPSPPVRGWWSGGVLLLLGMLMLASSGNRSRCEAARAHLARPRPATRGPAYSWCSSESSRLLCKEYREAIHSKRLGMHSPSQTSMTCPTLDDVVAIW